MSKNTKWVVLFALVVASYAASQHFKIEKGKEFKSPLLNFLPEDISVIKVHEFGNTPFQLLRMNEKWLLSANTTHEEAEKVVVDELLKLLKTVRTTEITSQQKNDWPEYELTDEQGTLICLETSDQQLPCVRFGSIRFSAEENALKAFARLDKEKEIYALNGFAISTLKNDFNEYRNKQILKIDAPIIQLTYWKDTSSFSISKWNNQWVNDELILQDCLVWENTIVNLANVSLDTFADNLDELALVNNKIGTLQLFTAKDSFRLDYFMDSTYTLPYILHSDQYPKAWMACDSSVFFGIIGRSAYKVMSSVR